MPTFTDQLRQPSGYASLDDERSRAAGEIERLTAALKKANAQAERFEREWYLRGDEIDRLQPAQDKLDRLLYDAQGNGFIGNNIDDAIIWATHQMGVSFRLRDELAATQNQLDGANNSACELREIVDRLDPPPGQCEHGVLDGDWCEPCNLEYKRAAIENAAAEKARAK